MTFTKQKMQQIVAEMGTKVKWEGCCSHLIGNIVSFTDNETVFVQGSEGDPVEVYFHELEFINGD